MQSKFEAALDKVMMENNIPGVIVGVWIQNEGSWLKAKGISNLATNEPMKLDNHFRMGSITNDYLDIPPVLLQIIHKVCNNASATRRIRTENMKTYME
jgi:D-alanyl-D-alanine carboxypeptidase